MRGGRTSRAPTMSVGALVVMRGRGTHWGVPPEPTWVCVWLWGHLGLPEAPASVRMW